jgi:hypothetical protein
MIMKQAPGAPRGWPGGLGGRTARLEGGWPAAGQRLTAADSKGNLTGPAAEWDLVAVGSRGGGRGETLTVCCQP